jgi:hypothetical protein
MRISRSALLFVKGISASWQNLKASALNLSNYSANC